MSRTLAQRRRPAEEPAVDGYTRAALGTCGPFGAYFVSGGPKVIPSLVSPVQVASLDHRLDTSDPIGSLVELTRDSQVAESIYRLPLPPLAGTGIGYVSDYDDPSYTYVSGLYQIQIIDEFWRRHRAKNDVYRVLDFGCGSGRLLRFVCELGSGVAPIGCDVNPHAVTWLSEHFPCPVHRLTTSCELPFLKEPVDLIYAWSIFSHFSESTHHDWLQCLLSSLAPGGLLLATFKTTEQIRRLETDPAYRTHSRATLDDIESLKIQARSGYAFFASYDPNLSPQHGIDPHTFGQSYVSHDYIRREWAKYGEVAEIGCAAEGWQDMVVIRKPAN